MRRRWLLFACGWLAAAQPAAAITAEVAVDVGHYFEKPGVISASGIPEFEYNRNLAFKVRQELEAAGLRVRMIGERGDFADLYERTKAARGVDLFVSIHHDSVQEQYLPIADRFSGFSLFVSRQNPQVEKSRVCASAIGAEMLKAGFTRSLYHADAVLGESRPFADEANGVHYFDNLAVARSATMPALLFEAGVLVNRNEEALLARPETQALMAGAIARGVVRCLN
jgi:N-acetylmuramoyl-L-alanine amidase